MGLEEIYTELVSEHSRSPEHRHALPGATCSLKGHNPSCGDEITLQLKVKDGVVEDAAFTGIGCAISQASTAMMAELLQGRTVPEALRLCRLFLDMIRGKVTDESELEELEAAITLKDISKMPVRVKCATLGWHTLEMALEKIEKELTK